MQATSLNDSNGVATQPKRYFKSSTRMHWPEVVQIVSLHFHFSKVILLCRVIVCGGGIIGSAIAYYLTLKGVATTVVERAAIACASSGVPEDCLFNWHDKHPTGSFALLHVRVVLLDTNQILTSSCHKAHVTITEHAPVFTSGLSLLTCWGTRACIASTAKSSGRISAAPWQGLIAARVHCNHWQLVWEHNTKCFCWQGALDCPSWTTAAQVHIQ